MDSVDKYENENENCFFSLKIDAREVARMLIVITTGLLRASHTGVNLSVRRGSLP
jgi:hypothetical protein